MTNQYRTHPRGVAFCSNSDHHLIARVQGVNINLNTGDLVPPHDLQDLPNSDVLVLYTCDRHTDTSFDVAGTRVRVGDTIVRIGDNTLPIETFRPIAEAILAKCNLDSCEPDPQRDDHIATFHVLDQPVTVTNRHITAVGQQEALANAVPLARAIVGQGGRATNYRLFGTSIYVDDSGDATAAGQNIHNLTVRPIAETVLDRVPSISGNTFVQSEQRPSPVHERDQFNIEGVQVNVSRDSFTVNGSPYAIDNSVRELARSIINPGYNTNYIDLPGFDFAIDQDQVSVNGDSVPRRRLVPVAEAILQA